MDNKFPLYPKLDDIAQEQAEELTKNFLDKFKKEAYKVLDELTNEFVFAVVDHIEGDAWNNFRVELMEGLCNYNNRIKQGRYDYDKIRKAIYDKYKDEIIKDLNQDLVAENEELKERIKNYQNKTTVLQDRLYGLGIL
jgi:hypothetical protein